MKFLPQIPDALRTQMGQWFYQWWQAFGVYMNYVPQITEGALADRPTATGSGNFYFATDTGVLYYDKRT